MKELTRAMETIANQVGEDDAGHLAEATSKAFIARETTCQQQLRFLERVYDDRFSVSPEEAKTTRTRMILDSMNDVIPSLDYSDENGNGSIEALKLIKELYANIFMNNLTAILSLCAPPLNSGGDLRLQEQATENSFLV